jgi:glycosyltransferase involved in cell wall biosynthesis
MRVVLVGPYPLDPTRFGGGVETSFFNLVEGLSSFADIEAHVVTFVRGARQVHRIDTGTVSVLYLPGRARFNNVTLYRSDRRRLERVLERLEPDVVHAQDAVGYGYVALRAARGVPVVVSIHGIVREEPKHIARRADRVRTRIARVTIERYCVRHARYLVAPTPYPEEYFGSEIRGRIVDVGNAISDRFFAVEPAPEPGRVLYVGGITRGKRLLDLVEALARVRRSVPDVLLRVAGPPTDPEYAGSVDARIRDLGLGARVALLGALPTETLIDEYRRASLLVLPSGQETSPMVIGEAMAAGVPVVATRTGGVPYLVADGETGYVVGVGDVGALGERMSQTLLDDGARAALAAASRSVARGRFRSVDVATRVRDVYRSALADGA